MSAEIRHTACPLDCPDLCHLEVEVADDRVQRVRGGRRNPLTDGVICGKVRKIADHLYGDERLRHPMIRVGAKGDAAFRPASWDEALDLVARRLDEIRRRDGGEAILPMHYGGSNGWLTEGALATRFFRRLGASKCLRTLCAAATTAAARAMYGTVPGVALEDYAHARMIVLWGVNPSATGIHLVPIIERAMAEGAELVVVDPRSTPLARRAHLHLPVRPGTDLPVALAMITALFERGLADASFLAASCDGAAELRARAAPWTVARAADVAGIAPRLIDELVERYAAASPAVIRCGWGQERNRNGGASTAAILALPAVAGKFGVRGGGYTMSNGEARWGVGPEAGIAEAEPEVREINMSQLAMALSPSTRPPITGLFIYNCNPLATVPNQEGVRRGLARDDLFTVVHEQVMTDSARWADVLLPASNFLEHRDIRRGYGAMRLFDSPAVVPPIGEARSNNQLFGALLERMGLTRAGDPTSDDELADAIFAGPRGADLRAQLHRDGVAAASDGPAPVLYLDLRPATGNGRIQLVPESLDRAASGGLYAYLADPATERYPLALISPAISTLISSTFGQLRTAPGTLAMHPDDALRRGIGDGDAVRAWNDLGEVRCAAQINRDLRPGVVMMPKGLWARHTQNGRTANALIPDHVTEIGGGACYNDARVEVARL